MKNKWKMLLMSFALMPVFGMASCSNDDDDNPGSGNMTVTPTELKFEQAGGVQTFTVQNGGEQLDVKSDADWCKVKWDSSPSKTARNFSVTVASNLDENERAATITVKGNGMQRVSVAQAGKVPDGGGDDDRTGMESDAKTLAAKMYAGINIGNTMEVPGGETGWGNPKVSQQYIRGLKALGFNAVRIPCAWDSHVSNAADNTIDPAWLDRVNEVVGWIVAEDMYAILNIHWDGGWLEEHVHEPFSTAIDKKMKDYWTQIATKLKHFDEHLLFAGMNEPGQQNGTNNAVSNIIRYQQTFIDAVRATGGKNAWRVLVVQAPNTNIDLAVKSDYRNNLPVDKVADRLLAEIHFYDPSDFTIMSKDGEWSSKVKWYWGAPNLVEGSDRNATWADESYVASQFDKMKKSYVNAGIPCILGEYGTSIRTNATDMEKHKASRAYWNEVVTREAKKGGCVPFYWETGGDVDRKTGAAINAYAIEGLMKGAAEGKYPF